GHNCRSGEIGRHARFRGVCRKTCGFESHLRHSLAQGSVQGLPPFASIYPAKARPIPRTLLSRILTTASFVCPSRKRLIVSSENAEKVVKPPRKPIKRKARIAGVAERFPNAPRMSPAPRE